MPTAGDSTRQSVLFEGVFSKRVQVDFGAEAHTSDAGVLLVAAADGRLGLTEALASDSGFPMRAILAQQRALGIDTVGLTSAKQGLPAPPVEDVDGFTYRRKPPGLCIHRDGVIIVLKTTYDAGLADRSRHADARGRLRADFRVGPLPPDRVLR